MNNVMPLPIPSIDDRSFQDLVNEARLRIPQLCPEWTDHNVSDPGIAMIELFAWMTESLIYRANQIPDRNYIKFMELVGIQLKPAVPAETDVTFRLSAPREVLTTIPSGTEIATVRTETEEAIIFTTTEAVHIDPPQLVNVSLTSDDNAFRERLSLLNDWRGLRAAGINPALQGDGDSFPLFEQIPETGNKFYFGYSNSLAGLIVALDIECVEAEGSGVNPNDPPIRWEYWDQYYLEWIHFGKTATSYAWLESDTTRGLNIPGRIVLHVPRTAGKITVNGKEAFWLRCVSMEPETRQGKYVTSPQIKALDSFSVGGVSPASNFTWSYDEVLGYSNGKPSQTFDLFHSPMLAMEPGEPIEVQREDGEGWETWDVVRDFSNSSPYDRHVTCDPVYSQIAFGPIVKSDTNTEKSYGSIPKMGLQIRVPAYKYGGGPIGNTGSNTLVVLKSSIPYVSTVTNRMAAKGGSNPETLDQGKMRTPNVLRSRERAVTKEDYEYLAKESSPSISRAYCLEPVSTTIGELNSAHLAVQILLVPQYAAETVRPDRDRLNVPQHIKETVTKYLDERRMVGTPLIVTEAEYIFVSIEGRIKLLDGADRSVARDAIERALYTYIHPVSGGEYGEGWPFGKDLYIPDIINRIQAIPEVEYSLELNASRVDPDTGNRSQLTNHVAVDPTQILCSATHIIQFI